MVEFVRGTRVSMGESTFMNLALVLKELEFSHPIFFYLIFFSGGLLIGSFLNVLIYRLPKMMEQEWRDDCNLLLDIKSPAKESQAYNLFLPLSFCPNCQCKIFLLEKIPIISFILLGGRCKECKERISWRYPIIEIISGISALCVAINFGISIQTIPALLFTFSLLALSAIDFEHKFLPDNITLSFLWLGVICNIFEIFTDIYSCLFGAIFGYLTFWVIYTVFKILTGKETIGRGDFKLLAMLGAWLGWQLLPLIIFLSSLLGSIVGIGLTLANLHKRSQPIAFGPYLAIAGWIALIFGNNIMNIYFGWLTN